MKNLKNRNILKQKKQGVTKMKTLNVLKGLIFVVLLLNLAFPQTQVFTDNETLIKIGQEYAKNYLSPLTTGLGTLMNTGYIGAYGEDVQKKGIFTPRFYIGVKGCGTLMNSIDDNFNFEFETNAQINGAKVPIKWVVKDAPRIFGNSSPAVAYGKFEIMGKTFDTSVTLLGGYSSMPVLPYAIPRIGLGTLAGTDIMLSGLPGINIGEFGKVNVYGIAIRHNLNAYLKLPLGIAFQGGFQKLTLTDKNSSNVFDATSSFINLQVSKRISIISLYAGIQYETYNIDVNLKYNDYSVQFSQQNLNPMRGVFGLTLNLGPFKLNGDINYGERVTFTGGLGVTF
jgi:hypothetical protein